MIKDEYGNLLGAEHLGENVYEYDWYSGSQISVMFGDIVIDSAVAIDFNVQQSKTPVYGYANQYYSFVADGKVLVQGSLTIAFKETGYLLYPMQRFAEKTAGLSSATAAGTSYKDYFQSPRFSIDSSGNINNTYEGKGNNPLTEASAAARRKQVLEANVEQVMEWKQASETGEDRFAEQKYNRFWRELGALPDNAFEDYAEAFGDVLWYGSEKANPFVRDRLYSRNVPEGEAISEESLYQHRRLDQFAPIDIWVIYGDMSRHPANHTVKKLLDVSFVGQAQSIEISGQPTLERYDFIAKNLV